MSRETRIESLLIMSTALPFVVGLGLILHLDHSRAASRARQVMAAPQPEKVILCMYSPNKDIPPSCHLALDMSANEKRETGNEKR